MKNKKNVALILASGSGSRFGGELPKQFVKIAGKTVLEHTIYRFEKNKNIDEIIIVINPKYYDYAGEILLKNNFTKLKTMLNGGETGRESTYIGLCACDENTENVLTHDAVRPFVSDEVIDRTLKALGTHQAVDTAIPMAEAVIKVNDDSIITDIPIRKYLMRGQTPQAFKFKIIKKAHELALKDKSVDSSVTDNCALVKHFNLTPVYVVKGAEKNIKITYKEDLILADRLFQMESISELEGAEKNNLQKKVLVVFGASSGFGKEISNLAIQKGLKVYGFSRKNGIDVSEYNLVAKALKEVSDKESRIDFVVNTAGILNIGKLESRNIADIYTDICVNYLGSINVTKAAIPYLRLTQGQIVLFTSSSYTRGRALYSTYSSTKAALVNFTQAMSEELMNEKIRINIISPERANTPMRWKAFGKEPADSLLSPEKVAKKTLELLQSNITGQVIDVKK